MHRMLVYLGLTLLGCVQIRSTVFPIAVLANDNSDSNVIIARGLLTRSGLAVTLWALKTENAPKIRGEAITHVTFTTPVGSATRAYDGYAGKVVELTGEVTLVDHGTAVLRRVWTIGILPEAPLTAAAASMGSLAAVKNSDTGRVSQERLPYQHGYYLFLASLPRGCEACYVPLLLCQSSLAEIRAGKQVAFCVLVITFERDSIWELRGAASIDSDAIHEPQRTIDLNGKSYRYQEISANEVVRLLENPAGTIPISRPMIMSKAVPGASLEELAADFHTLAEAPHANPSRREQ